MKFSDIAHLRLRNQQIVGSGMKTPAEVVAHFGAMQGQDYAQGKWAIGLRLPGATDADVEQAIANKTIVRTWPMRSTLHFVTAADIRWLIALTGERTIASHKSRYTQLELDEPTLKRSTELIMKALQGGTSLDRHGIIAMLKQNGENVDGQRGVYMLARACLEGLICQSVTLKGKASYFEISMLPKTPDKTRDEALAELAVRYFTSHGPATLADFTWWSGLKISDARAAMEMVKSRFVAETVDGQTYMLPLSAAVTSQVSPDVYALPAYDEFLIAYKDRTASLKLEHNPLAESTNRAIFYPIIVIDGQVVGLWKRAIKKDKMTITAQPFTSLTNMQKKAWEGAARRFADYLGVPAVLL